MRENVVARVVDLMTPSCLGCLRTTRRLVRIPDEAEASECFKFVFMFDEFWSLKEAEAARARRIEKKTAEIMATLKEELWL